MMTPVDVGPSCCPTRAAPVVVQLVRFPRSNPPLRMPARQSVTEGIHTGVTGSGLSSILAATVDPEVLILPVVEPLDPRNGSKPVTVKGPPLMNNLYCPAASVTETNVLVELLTTTPGRGPLASDAMPVAKPEPVSATIA